MKYLVIAEKPSVSKSIAKVIGAYRQEDGYLEGGDCVVSWCLGHLAEYAAPEHYDERYENWRFEDLPILPAEWKLLVHNTKKPQLEADYGKVPAACRPGEPAGCPGTSP